jgi:transitional endoplasmic reticulum ATPase
VKLPFFYAQNAQERGQIIRALLKRHGIAYVGDDAEIDALGDALANYSNADLEAMVLLAASMVTSADGVTSMTQELLSQAMTEFIRPNDGQMIRMMELLAVFESSRRSWLPASLQQADLGELRNELMTLKTILH